MSLKDFQVVSKLGEGTYSTVYKVLRIQDNQTYALKRVKILNMSPKQKENALNQIRILASIRHPNITAYKQAFFDQASKSLCIIMEYANEKDVEAKIVQQQKKGGFLPQTEIWNLFIQVVKGLQQLHRLNIFHRDIKPANVFLFDGKTAKLGDMNVSKITERGFCMTQTGTPYYASPQVWKDQPYDQKSDIWSLGCVLYQLITLKVPFKAQDMEGLFKKVTRGIYQRLPAEFSQDLNSVIRALLQVNPDARPSCQKILKMPQVAKRIKYNIYHQSQTTQLLKTIKGDNIFSIGEVLPKSNYVPIKIKRTKGIKSLIDSVQQRQYTVCEVESLPALQRQKKIMPGQHSDRLNKVNNVLRERKKSQVASSRSGLQINGINVNYHLDDSKQLKLPKVQNRYQKVRDRLGKQKSLKCHKPLGHN